MKRREMLISLGLTPLLPPLLSRTVMATETKTAEQELELLFVQSADAVDLKDGILKLTGINPATIFFSDRPERIVGHEPTEDFVAQWGIGDNNFAENPPNAALSILKGSEPQEVILELRNPQIKDGGLTYEVTVLQGKASVSGDAASLFIDPLGRPMSPASVAGVHRRHRRRAIRRPGPGPL